MSVETESQHSNSQKEGTILTNSKSGKVSNELSMILNPLEIRTIVKRCLKTRLKDKEYETNSVQNTAKDLSNKIKNEIKNKAKDNYKIIVQVIISENKDQGFRVVNKCFWDASKDFSFIENFSNDFLFAICLVYLLKNY